MSFRATRTTVAVLSAAALAVTTGCDDPGRDESDYGPEAVVATVPPDMVESSWRFFAFVVPASWDSRSRGGSIAGTLWTDEDERERLFVSLSNGWIDGEEGTKISLSAPGTVARYFDATPEPGHLPDQEIIVSDVRTLDPPRAAGAWQYHVTDVGGREHVLNHAYVSGQVLSMYFLGPELDADLVAQVTESLVAEDRHSPWSPPAP